MNNRERFSTTEQILTVEEYLQLTEQEKATIVASTITPAKLGESSFGQIQVKYKYPRLIQSPLQRELRDE